METTRHFVATVHVVHDGATALHEHERLEMWLPPGGHVERGETPAETARREVAEELGIDVTLVADRGGIDSDRVRSLPEPEAVLLEDIDVCDGAVAHQHVDFVYLARAESRAVDPAEGEAPADAWEWFTPADLEARRDELAPNVHELGRRAIEAVGAE